MNTKLLADAIRAASSSVSEVRDEVDNLDDTRINTESLRQARDLLRVLARIVDGTPMPRAFGAPGDWGYENDIGRGVYQMLCVPTENVTSRA
jgi:hypothetical protein